MRHEHASCVHLALETPEMLVQQHVYPPWDEVVAAHMRSLWSFHQQHDLRATFDCQAVLVQSLTKIMQNLANENWPLEVMLAVVVDLRRLAASVRLSFTTLLYCLLVMMRALDVFFFFSVRFAAKQTIDCQGQHQQTRRASRKGC